MFDNWLMDLGLKGRRALVAAASKGLGRACAAALVAEGASVFRPAGYITGQTLGIDGGALVGVH